MNIVGQNGNDGEHYQHIKEREPTKITRLHWPLLDDPNLFIGNKEDKGEGLRFNSDKPRYDLLHPVAQAGIVSVLTAGAKKYAPRNWEKGMNWSTILSSMKKHLKLG